MRKRQLLTTMSGELFQPVRIYYIVHDKAGVKKVLRRLKCIEYDPIQDRYVWLYEKEARKLVLGKPYNEIAPEVRPLVIGSFFSPNNQEMYMQTNSIERAVNVIPFFEGYLKQHLAEITDIAVINRLFDAAEYNTGKIESLFQKAKILEQPLIQSSDKAVPTTYAEVERFPYSYFDSKIDILHTQLRARQEYAQALWRSFNATTIKQIVRNLFRT